MRIQQHRLLKILLLVGLLQCSPDYKAEKTSNLNAISIKAVNENNGTEIKDYALYEVTHYPEGVIHELQSVAAKYRYKDSAGMVCIPLLPDSLVKERFRVFVFVKDSYVYTRHYLSNTFIDTVLGVISIKDAATNTNLLP
jgi:hypothetical protein